MHAQTIEHMFRFTFEKSADEIKRRAVAKISQITKKIGERQDRVARLRKEYGITDDVFVDLLRKAREADQSNAAHLNYTTVSKPKKGLREGAITIGAGVVNNLLTESDFIDSEKAQVKQLQLIVRNLRDLPDRTITTLAKGVARPTRGHQLSYEELEFLGF